MPEEKKENNIAYGLLSVFIEKYNPATIETATDTFSSKEITAIIESHLGESILLSELHSVLLEMGYDYTMSDNEFIWLCQKD